MKDFTTKFKIPTLLGLAIILIGIIGGVVLTLREQPFLTKASPDFTPQNITLSNISDTSITISYQTSAPVISFITYGPDNPGEQTTQDDRDAKAPQPHILHYITLKNLLPKTTYLYKIISGKQESEIQKFTTSAPLNQQTGLRPIIGSVLDNEKAVDEGIVYLSIADAQTLSAPIKTVGNFLIPLSQIRKADLSDIFPIEEDTLIKLTVLSEKDEARTMIKFKLLGDTLPPMKLGQNVDLSNPEPAPESIGSSNKFDLNKDGKINAADNAILLQNFGKKGKDIPGDLNKDGTVDQKDLGLMAKQINQ